jgi:hypothetical protein
MQNDVIGEAFRTATVQSIDTIKAIKSEPQPVIEKHILPSILGPHSRVADIGKQFQEWEAALVLMNEKGTAMIQEKYNSWEKNGLERQLQQQQQEHEQQQQQQQGGMFQGDGQQQQAEQNDGGNNQPVDGSIVSTQQDVTMNDAIPSTVDIIQQSQQIQNPVENAHGGDGDQNNNQSAELSDNIMW